jgi:hypothetical protein
MAQRDQLVLKVIPEIRVISVLKETLVISVLKETLVISVLKETLVNQAQPVHAASPATLNY